MEAMQAAEAAKAPVLGPNGEVLGADGMPVRNAEGKFIGADGQPLPEPELSAEEMGVVEMQEGETLEDIKAKLKPKKSSISLDLLNTANSYDDKVALIRFLVSEDSGRVANVFKTLMRPTGG
jgi:flagellar M-ring protein FliF